MSTEVEVMKLTPLQKCTPTGTPTNQQSTSLITLKTHYNCNFNQSCVYVHAEEKLIDSIFSAGILYYTELVILLFVGLQKLFKDNQV